MPAEDVADLDQLISLASSDHSHNDESSVNNDMYSVNSSLPPSDHRIMNRLDASIKKFANSGKRTIALKQSCLKYSSFSDLDRALNLSKSIQELSDDDLKKLKQRREMKAMQLLQPHNSKNGVMTSSTHEASLIESVTIPSATIISTD